MERTSFTGLQRPNFMVDPHSAVRNSGRQINWDLVPRTFNQTPPVTATANGISAAAATTFAVDALTSPIPAGSVLILAAGTKQIRTSADAAIGATSISVEALAEATVDNEVYTWEGIGPKVIKAGQPMGISSGKMVPRTASIAAVGLLEGPAVEGDRAAAKTGYGLIVGGAVYENLLPEISSTIKTELETNGLTFYWETYADDRAS